MLTFEKSPTPLMTSTSHPGIEIPTLSRMLTSRSRPMPGLAIMLSSMLRVNSMRLAGATLAPGSSAMLSFNTWNRSGWIASVRSPGACARATAGVTSETPTTRATRARRMMASLCSRATRQLVSNRRGERFQGCGPFELPPVDEERGGRLDAKPPGVRRVRFDGGAPAASRDALVVGAQIEIGAARRHLQVRAAFRIAGKQQRAVRPEAALRIGAPRRLVRLASVRMDRFERQVTMHESNGIKRQNLAEHRLRLSAVRAQEVGELDDGDRRIRRPLGRRTRRFEDGSWRPRRFEQHANRALSFERGDERGQLGTYPVFEQRFSNVVA